MFNNLLSLWKDPIMIELMHEELLNKVARLNKNYHLHATKVLTSINQ